MRSRRSPRNTIGARRSIGCSQVLGLAAAMRSVSRIWRRRRRDPAGRRSNGSAVRARIHLIAGARPNFMKIAPLWHALARAGERFEVAVVHTGQHYDDEMSDVFLRQFNLPRPHYALGAGGGSHAEQTAAVMTAYERVCMTDPPDWVIVVGDVNSTMAATLAAKKLMLSVAHLEAGLRSFDRTMPEEINRLVTDALADLLWTPSGRIDRVGNIMIDAFEMLRDEIAAS